MLDETLFALFFANENADGAWSVFAFLGSVVAPFLAAALGTVWLGGSGESAPDEATELKERTTGAFRTFSEIVSAFVAARDAAKRRQEQEDRQASDRGQDQDNGGGAKTKTFDSDAFSSVSDSTSDSSKETDREKPSAPNGATSSSSDSPKVDSDKLGALNPVDFWREDYWNYDFRLDRDDFNPNDDDSDDDDFDSVDFDNSEASDNTDASHRSNDSSKTGDSDAAFVDGPVRNDRDAREGLDPTPEETENQRRSRNYFGAFFQNKKRSDSSNGSANSTDADDSDKSPKEENNESNERKPRWKRPNDNGLPPNSSNNAKDDVPDDVSNDPENNGLRSGEKSKIDDLNGLSDWTRLIFDSEQSSNSLQDDKSNENDDDSEELEFNYWNDGAAWDDGPNEKYLDDESVSDDEKLDYLRKRIAGGDDASREELARLLVQIAAEASRDEQRKALAALDEAREIAAEAAENGEEERVEFLGQILLQRPLFYLRNGLEPSQAAAAANEALAQIRSWAEYSSNTEARRLLATAWQTQGNCLVAVGCEATAVASLKTAVDLFETIIGEGATDAEPSLGYAAATLGDAYLSVGDRPRAIESFRKAIETFDKYSAQEPFLAEKVNVLFRLAVALRQNGDADDAERALQEAVDAEERLLSLDEENYIAPAAQLLNIQADFYFRREAFEDALVALDQAISALKRYLACDVALSNRVRAYLTLEASLRKRAIVCLWLERYSAAIRDAEEGLEYLALAIKKDENVEPISQLVACCGLIYDCGVSRGDWTFVLESQEALETLISRLTPEETRQIAPLYGQLLLQRHVALAQAGRLDEALAATDRAIAALEDRVDDGALECRVLLAKAFFQRGVFQEEVRENVAEATANFARAQQLFEETKAESELDETSAALFLSLLARKSLIEIKANDFDAAFQDLQTGIVESFRLLRQNRWRYVDELENLSRTSVLWARVARSDEQALRVVRIWTRYWRRLRRLFVESSWRVERTISRSFEENTIEESDAVQKILEKIEGAVADLRRLRVEILETIDWKDEYSKYFNVSELDVAKRRGVPSDVRFEASVSVNVAENAAPSRSDAFRSSARRVVQFCRDFFSLKRFKNVSQTADKKEDESPETEPNATNPTLNSLKDFPLEAARSAFATETLANDSKSRCIFADLLFCIRVVVRRIEQGDLTLTKIYYQLLDKLTDVYLAEKNLLVATAETLDATRRFESAEPWRRAKGSDEVKNNVVAALITALPNASTDPSNDKNVETPTSGATIFRGPTVPDDASFFADIFPFWELQTSFLARLTGQKNAPSDDVSTGFDVELADRTFRTTIEIARRSDAAPAVDAESQSDDSSQNLDFLQSTAAKFRALAAVDVYFGWLAKRGRVDEGLTFIRKEEKRLKNAFKNESRFDFLTLGIFYYNFGDAAFDAGLLDEAKKAYWQAEEVFQEEENKCGADASLWERRGNARHKLGRLAAIQENASEAAQNFREALNYYRRDLEAGAFDGDVFRNIIQITIFLLETNPLGAGNFAFEQMRALEKIASNWSDDVGSATKIAFWQLKTAAAHFCSRRGFSPRYRSFYTIKRLYQEANQLLASPELANIPPRLIAEVKRQEAEYWIRSGFISQARAALEAAIRAWTAEAKTSEKMQDASKNAASKPSDGSESAADFLFVLDDNARKNIFIDRFFIATTFVQERNLDEARRLFDPILKIERLGAKRAAQILARGRKKDANEILIAKSAAATLLIVERAAAELEMELGRAAAACRRNRRATLAARKLFGPNSSLEQNGAVSWAQSALSAKRYGLAIDLTERVVQASEKAQLENESVPVFLWIAALQIQAAAFLERRRRGDLERAEKSVEKALEMLRAEFSRKYFFELRGLFAETLFVKARLEAERQNLEAAQNDAARVRRILATLVRRGQTYRQTFLRDKVEPFLLLTEERLATKKRETPESELVKMIQSGQTNRLSELLKKGEKETNDDEPR